jgi:Fe-S-cluster containining protein
VSADPGLAGVVPFRFACHRCGHCCSGGEGHVWVEDDEVAPMARRLGMDRAAFVSAYLRTVPDPRSGELRQALTEDGGRCSLLEGTNHCRVYEDRPAHCAGFPYWPSVLEEEAGFERARAVCPGIAVEVEEEQQAAAFAALEAVYAEVEEELARLAPRCELSGRCCRFDEFGHELFATGLEADYAVSRAQELPAADGPGRCHYHQAGRCTNREGRALGCRTFFCDERTTEALEELHARLLERVRAIDYPAAYGRFPALLEARGKIQPPGPSVDPS